MISRTMLAVLDHNENVRREQIIRQDGKPAWFRVFPRGLACGRHWKIRPIKVAKTFQFRNEISRMVLQKLYAGDGIDEIRTADSDSDSFAEDQLSSLERPTVPLALVEKPTQERLISKRLPKARVIQNK